MNENPSKDIAVDIFKVLSTRGDVDTSMVLSAVSIVLATIAVEAGMEEEKAVYAFRKSYGHASSRLKKMMKEVH